MNIKRYFIQENSALVLGYAGEHNANAIQFARFTREDEHNIVYAMFGKPIEKMIPLSDDLSFVVQTNITAEAGMFDCELLETDGEGNLIKKSPVFTCIVKEAIDPTEEIEVTDPSLDLLYADLYKTYITIKDAYESGEFKGEPGEPGEPGRDGEPGKDGEPGEPGKDGYTPIKGIDYFDGKDGKDGKDAEPYDDTEIKAEISQLSESITNIEGEVADKITLADIPIANYKNPTGLGLVRSGSGGTGVYTDADGYLRLNIANNNVIDNRSNPSYPITTSTLVHAVDSVITSKAATEQLTDEQKAAARERIGAAKSGKFELIEEITLTEDTVSIERTAEPNGAPYKFSGIILEVRSNNVSSDKPQSDGWLRLNHYNRISSDWVYASNGVAFSNSRRYSNFYFIKHLDGHIESGHSCSPNDSNTGSVGANDQNIKIIPSNILKSIEYIDSLLFYSYTNPIPAGTNIKIYGVRA